MGGVLGGLDSSLQVYPETKIELYKLKAMVMDRCGRLKATAMGEGFQYQGVYPTLKWLVDTGVKLLKVIVEKGPPQDLMSLLEREDPKLYRRIKALTEG